MTRYWRVKLPPGVRSPFEVYVNGVRQEIPNDYMWIFAGGEPPTAFLKKIGVGFGSSDVTAAASAEAKQIIRAKLGSPVLVQSGLTVS